MTTRYEMGENLKGLSLIGAGRGSASGETFRAFDPLTGEAIDPAFHSASVDEVDRAVQLSDDASDAFRDLPKDRKSRFLRSVASNLEAIRTELVERAALETGLPEARFEGELGRTCGQLRMFAEIIEEGSWVDARIDHAVPDREPIQKPDVRSMLRPAGPVAVFCASNFPLAFSVAGGDTASALAAGCPVIVVGHTSHPGTAELAGTAITRSVKEAKLPEGIFSLLFSKSYEAGQMLVRHPMIKSVGFTGSRRGGRALMEIAASREEPIPVFAEMSSANPVFLMPDALRERHDELAKGLYDSFTLGHGQFCTKPGIVFLSKGEESARFAAKLEAMAKDEKPVPMLSAGIRDAYISGSESRADFLTAGGYEAVDGFGVFAEVFRVTAGEFLRNESLADELFGPSTLIVECDSPEEFQKIAQNLEGQLTATVHATPRDYGSFGHLLETLETKAGRIVLNAFPTGVEVCDAMVHGGPYPATSDSRSTSVGGRAIERFCRLVAFQGFPDELLPPELKNENPLGIVRKES